MVPRFELKRCCLFSQATKIDQYVDVDRKWDKDSDLHAELFKKNKHPNNIRYCLVARVVLGRHVRTQNGETQLDSPGKPLFTDDRRSQLAPFDDGATPSSLVAETGGRVQGFREFVVFNPDQIFIEYVIAYRRVRRFCTCGLPIVERTVVKAGDNHGRRIHQCGKAASSGGDYSECCDFIQMFPLCDCGKSAIVLTSHSSANPNRPYYACYKKKSRGRYGYGIACDFFQWK